MAIPDYYHSCQVSFWIVFFDVYCNDPDLVDLWVYWTLCSLETFNFEGGQPLLEREKRVKKKIANTWLLIAIKAA